MSEVLKAEANPIYLCGQAVDMRLSFDGLKRIIERDVKLNKEALYIFVNANFKKVKLFYWDRNGWAIWYKNIEKGVFAVERKDGYSILNSINMKLLVAGVEKKRLTEKPKAKKEKK